MGVALETFLHDYYSCPHTLMWLATEEMQQGHSSFCRDDKVNNIVLMLLDSAHVTVPKKSRVPVLTLTESEI